MYLYLHVRMHFIISFQIIVNYLYYNQYDNLFVLIIITIPYYYSCRILIIIHVEYLMHMPYNRTIIMCILYKITTHVYVCLPVYH